MNRTIKFTAFIFAALTFAACQSKVTPEPKPEQQDTTATEKPDTSITEKPDTTGLNDVVVPPKDDNSAFEGLTHNKFEESDEKFPNPERGFYSVDSYHEATDAPISVNMLNVRRKLNRTITYLGYYLTEYMESDIAQEYLDLVETNMKALREGGSKCVLRFAYKNSEAETNHPWDASPEWVARHIEQLKPIVQEYSDVILCWQAGFVGVWGEWYYTDHFVSRPKTPEEHALRKEVIDAMLDALPKTRQVGLRTPMFARMMYAQDYTDTLTIATAHDGSDRSRLAGFNDCFVASSSDQGTFDGSATREFWKNDTKYVFMGGETCAVSNYCLCDNTLKDMRDYHWTYINSEYNTQVISKWRQGGCLDEIERRLGYRLSLSDVFHTPSPAAGADMRIALRIKNSGFSAPINPRGFELILVDGNGVKTVYDNLDVDPRFWFADQKVVVDKVIKLPADASGKCILYLNLPDPEATLHDNPLFSIRLANENVWDEATGYNKVAEFTL